MNAQYLFPVYTHGNLQLINGIHEDSPWPELASLFKKTDTHLPFLLCPIGPPLEILFQLVCDTLTLPMSAGSPYNLPLARDSIFTLTHDTLITTPSLYKELTSNHDTHLQSIHTVGLFPEHISIQIEPSSARVPDVNLIYLDHPLSHYI